MIDEVESLDLRVCLFGTPTVGRSTVPIHLSPQQLALVALVYGHGAKGLSRPEAIRLLWQSHPDTSARHRLRQLLATIRSRVARNLIESHRDVLKPAHTVQCDLVDFEDHLRDGKLSRAAKILEGGFARLSPAKEARGYDNWRSARELTLIRRLRTRASVCFERATRVARLEVALDSAEALYVLDAADAEAVRRVIEARGRAGKIAAAEAAFAVYLEGLDITQEPDPAILKSLQCAREAAQQLPSSFEAVDADVPLVGRTKAILAAREVFSVVERGRFGFALITGEPGIGKTRLLRELHKEATFLGFRCLQAQAIEVESRLPLTPLLDSLAGIDLGAHLAALGDPWNAVISAVLPAGAVDIPPREPPPIQESAMTRRLLDAFSLLLGQLAQEKPTLFFLDDLHWADPTTVAVLQFVQRRWSGGPLGVIAAIREDLVRRGTPARGYLAPRSALHARRIPLGDLSIADARELVDHIGAGQVSEDAKSRICELSGLHPLFLTELTRDYIAGRLRLPQLPVDEVTIPVSLKEILDNRLEHLDAQAIKLAGMLAVAGRSLSVVDAAELTELTLDEAADAVDELLLARLISGEDNRLCISHELFRSAICRHIGEHRRAVNHRILAAHIHAGGMDDMVGELAIHYARAGEAELAARHGWSAARRARETGAVNEAAHFFQLVLENETDAVRRAEATAELAHALHLGRDIGRANPVLEVAATRLRAVGRSSEALRTEIRRVEGLVELGEAPIRDLRPMLDPIKQEARNEDDWEALALALDTELHLLHRDGDVEGIRELFSEMREVSSRGSTAASLLAHAGLALGVLFDDPDEALRSARQAVAMTSDAGAYQLTAMSRLLLVLHYRGMLSLPGSANIVDITRQLASRSGDVLMRFSIENNLAVAELDAGNIEQAEAIMARCADMSGAGDMDLNRAIQANNRAELALARRDFEVASRGFSDALTYLGITTPAYMQDLVNAGLGFCALERGNLSDARRQEQELHDPPHSWYFDPTTILAFRARLLERRGRYADAVAFLDANAANLEGRLVLAWLKVRCVQVRLMLRRQIDLPEARTIADQARRVADGLRLVHRSRELLELADLSAS